MNFQQCPQTLQSQRYGCVVWRGVGGIACDIRGKLAGRGSCAAARGTAGSAATGAGGGLAQRPGTVDTVAANDLPKPHRDRSRDHAQTHNLTTPSNTNFPAPTSRKVTTQPTCCPLTQLFRKATGLERCLRDTLSGSHRSHRDEHSTTIPLSCTSPGPVRTSGLAHAHVIGQAPTPCQHHCAPPTVKRS